MNESDKGELQKILKDITKNEIRISYHEQEELLPICSSKIGGKPAVPANFKWPEFTAESYDGVIKSRPLSFMAQINLRDTVRYDTEGILPKEGILSFFYEQMSMLCGFAPEEKGCAQVYYFPNEKDLTLMDIPADMDEEAVIPELAVMLEKHISIPEFSDFTENHEKMDITWDDYNECRAECGYETDDWGEVTKLLGYPDTIQSPMEEECEAVTRGYCQGCPEDYEKIPQKEKEDIKKMSAEWMLLFQMGTLETENAEYMFGDCGHLYFWIKKQDLKKLDFDKVWMIMQCS